MDYKNYKLNADARKYRVLMWIGVALIFIPSGPTFMWRFGGYMFYGVIDDFANLLELAGLILFFVSLGNVLLARKCRKYAAFLLSDTNRTLPQIALLCGRSPNKFMREISKMVQRGWLPAEVVFGGKPKAAEQEPPATVNTGVTFADGVLEQGRAFIARISMVEAQEEDLGTRNKIKEARLAATAIFEFVFEHPEAAASLDKFMEYKMPEAVKLLTTYQSVSRQTVVTEHITATKISVLETLDAIVKAMKDQLDALYRDMAVSTAADANVYRSMTGGGLDASAFSDSSGFSGRQQ